MTDSLSCYKHEVSYHESAEQPHGVHRESHANLGMTSDQKEFVSATEAKGPTRVLDELFNLKEAGELPHNFMMPTKEQVKAFQRKEKNEDIDGKKLMKAGRVTYGELER